MKDFISDYSLVVGLLVGALFQVATGWLTDARAAKREHRVWVRDRRADAFLALMTELQSEMFNSLSGMNDFEALHKFGKAYTAAQVFSPTQECLDLTRQIRAEVQLQRKRPVNQRSMTVLQGWMEKYEQTVRASLKVGRDA